MELAVDKFEALVQKVESDLNFVGVKLEREFTQNFAQPGSDQVNPLKLLERVRKARAEFSRLTKEMDSIQKGQQILGVSLQQDICTPLSGLKHVKLHSGKDITEITEFENEMSTFQMKDHMASKQQDTSTSNDDVNNNESVRPEFTIPEEVEPSPSEQRNAGKTFVPVTQEELDSVSDLIKGKCKLDDINKVYEAIFKCFKKKSSSCNPLTPKDMTSMGLKITGATGEAKLKVLRSLKIIQINKHGSVKMKS